jgi:hypothetical protein
MPARRLFDSDGREIFRSKFIRRDEEYYVSSGENFKSYKARAAVSYRSVLNQINLGQTESNETESIRMESDRTNLARPKLHQQALIHTGRSETVLVESTEYAFNF